MKADVGKEEDIKAAVDLAVNEFGRLDVMVRAPCLNYSRCGDRGVHLVKAVILTGILFVVPNC